MRLLSHRPVSRKLRLETLEGRQMLSANAASEAVNSFALDAYQHLQQEDGNLFFSPLSVSTALAMTSVGAAGQTATEMQQVFHLGADPAIHASFRELLVSQLGRSFTVDDFELIQANAIWPGLGLPVEQAFIDTIEDQYFGHVETVDYNTPQLAEQRINEWVAEQTEGKIEDLVSDLDENTAMVLTNAIYFNSLWDSPFDPRYTENGDFYLDPDNPVWTPIMYTNQDAWRTEIGGFDVLELPFVDGQSSMVLAMPNQQSGAGYLSSEVLSGIEQWVDGPRQLQNMQISLPKFTTTVETSLNQLLIGLGMPSAFSSGSADFSGITTVGVHIRKVFHKATIDVNEQGTEAAAATEVELAICFAKGTPVLTPDGAKPIESLRVGDVVLARNENDSAGELEPKVVEETRQGRSGLLAITVHGHVIRVTDLHPLFVEGQGWTPAGKLRIGDGLVTNGSESRTVEQITESPGEEPVYNLRVADHHTYFVGEEEWGFAVWTHNFYDEGFYADKPFHFMIRDNINSTIAFMGRIDDPTQLENEVTPTVAYPDAYRGDFNNDGLVNSSDHAVWSAAYGRTGVTMAGDGNGDGIVNAADYTIWRDHIGLDLRAPVLAAATASGVQAEVDASQATQTNPLTRSQYFGLRTGVTSNYGYRPASRTSFDATASEDSGGELLLLATDLGTQSQQATGENSESSTDFSQTSTEALPALDQGFAEIGQTINRWHAGE